MRVNNFKFTFLVLTITYFTSCEQEKETSPAPKHDASGKTYFSEKSSLLAHAQKSTETVKTEQINGFNFTITQLSADIMALRELNGKNFSKKEFEQTKEHYNDLYYFKLNISNPDVKQELLKHNLTNGQEYNDRVKYCSFHLNQDVFITNGKDTTRCALHEFERTFNLESGLNFLLAFPKQTANYNTFTLVLHDKLFKQGIIKFYYSRDIDDLPYLSLEDKK